MLQEQSGVVMDRSAFNHRKKPWHNDKEMVMNVCLNWTNEKPMECFWRNFKTGQ